MPTDRGPISEITDTSSTIVRSHMIPWTTVKAHVRISGISQAQSRKEVAARLNHNF